ncbi:metal-sensitive transcriptional regulator [Schaalia georgiae]|uniref:metal-sensitive transcriptional regulator n=1 Tax=Schaalia georgiae TaxID=52768 RepID=UPI000415FCD7|nr:metal-sensitive transcriptional regulator [Schaalia georgiae]
MSGTNTHGHPGYSADTARYLARLRRIEGQIRGLQRMVAQDEYCIDVLTQVSAVQSALDSVAIALLKDHMNHCVAAAARESDEAGAAKVEEATTAIARLIKS